MTRLFGDRRVSKTFFAGMLLAACLSIVAATSARADAPAPGWGLTGRTYPTNLPPGGHGWIAIDTLNVGGRAANTVEHPVTITDTLPEGMTATQAGEPHREFYTEPVTGSELWVCSGNGPGAPPSVLGARIVTCTSNSANMPSISGGGGWPVTRGPNYEPELYIGVNVSASAREETVVNHVTIAGGGALSPASTQDDVVVSSKAPGFGFAGIDARFSNADGTLDTQAGSHPYEATFSFDLNTEVEYKQTAYYELNPAGGEFRNLEVNLPPGLIGNPYAVPRCTRQQFLVFKCPDASQVGVVTILQGFVVGNSFVKPVYNLVPAAGEPAQLGFNVESVPTYLDVGVRTGGDYGLTTHVTKIAQRGIIGTMLTLWGVPADKSHDTWRGIAPAGGCTTEQIKKEEENCKSSGQNPSLAPFLTLPTSCAGPQEFSDTATTWEEPIAEGSIASFSHDSNNTPTGFTGCEHLQFAPTMTASPDTGRADTPAGMSFDVKPPVGGLLDPEGLGTSDIKNTTVTLPEGMVINPGQAAGLQACPASEDALGTEAAPSCPGASKVGTAEAETPLLKNKLAGNVYLLPSNPPNLRLLLGLSGEGVNVKLIIEVHLDETTGRLTATLKNIPALPVSDFKLSFSGGAQAALATPTLCGTYTTTADFGPWSSPFVADYHSNTSFAIESGSDGAPCPSNPLPFTPNLIAGSTTDQAGGFTNFSLLLQAPDDQKRIEKLQFKIPQGLLGMISRVPLCGEAQASTGTCSAASQIGHTTVASGPGPYPLVVPQPGQPPAPIYLTGPYRGAPYGLAIVVPVVVGPFTLQTQIVRAKIEVDPLTAQITVTTDPFPQVIDGVPTDLRTVNAVIDRPGFMFNPTSCSPMSFSGTAWGTPPPGQGGPGSTAAISTPFQMGSCRSLLFKPTFKVTTSGRTPRTVGASLDAKIVYPTGALGANQASSQSNLKSVKVDLPKQLPSRLTTLQKACTSQVFDANPANCPAASRVGTASAVTPVLPVELNGPAYFVSYGGEKFPELVFALQGYGVTIYVHGETFINKAGITSSTFHQVPDVPIYKFELNLPQGPYSALAANGNLCNTKLKMPTSFTAQDGAVIDQTTPISVTGCSKAKKAKGHAHHRAAKAGSRG